MDCLRRSQDDTQTSTKIWRPWVEEPQRTDPRKCKRLHPYARYPTSTESSNSHPLQSYASTFKHPVRLYWTKAAYDYMYEAGERLLRNFPVQATIQVVDESDSSDDEDEDYEVEDEDGDLDKDRENDIKDKLLDNTGDKKIEQDKNA